MCGIVAYKGHKNCHPILVNGLKRLEYRGYDSAGIASINSNNNLVVTKRKGKVSELESVLPNSEIFNFINLQALNEICYISHDQSAEKLRCCLDADYVWKEGFAFSKNTPNECDKYMNWNN